MISDLRDEIDDAENPLGAGDSLLDRVVHVGQPLDGFVKHDERRQKREEGSRRGLAVDDLIAAVEDDGRDA